MSAKSTFTSLSVVSTLTHLMMRFFCSYSHGRAFYLEPKNRIALSAGLDFYAGFTLRAIMAENPHLNVDGETRI